MSSASTFTIGTARTLTVIDSTINADVVVDGTLYIRRTLNNAINGTLTNNATGTVRLESDDFGGSTTDDARLTVSNGVSNAGLFEFQEFSNTSSSSFTIQLIVTAGQLVNLATGTITTDAPSTGPGPVTIDAELDNQGTITVDLPTTVTGAATNTGTITVNSGKTFTVQSTYTQTAGTIDLQGGILSVSTAPVDLQGGVLSGFGTINSDVTNGATVEVGGANAAGTLNINGDYTQSSAGILNMEIGGLTAGTLFDRLNINGGTADFAGTLNLSLINGFTPVLAQIFTIITYGTQGTNPFDTGNGTALGGGLDFSIGYNANDVTLTVS